MKKIKLILLFFIFIGIKSFGQDKKWTLQECVDYALKNNYKSINAARDIESSIQKKRETIAIGLPQINGGVDFLHNFIDL